MISEIINSKFEFHSKQNLLLKEVIMLLGFLRSLDVDDVSAEKIIRLRSGWADKKFVSPEFSVAEQKEISSYYEILTEVEL